MYVNRRAYSMCAIFTALIALGAFIRVPVPVVPFTLQFLFTNLAGLLLGCRKGALAVEAYILLGLAGIPVFTGGGGLAYILQPTFGYIIGFALGTALAGYIVEQVERPSLRHYLLAGAADLVIVYTLGLVWFYGITRYVAGAPLSIDTLLLYGFVLAVPGDILLCLGGALLAVRLQRTGLFQSMRPRKEVVTG